MIFKSQPACLQGPFSIHSPIYWSPYPQDPQLLFFLNYGLRLSESLLVTLIQGGLSAVGAAGPILGTQGSDK